MKIKNNHIFFINLLIFLSLLVLSCEDPVVLNLPKGEEKLVVDGWVTNENIPHLIALFKTINFNSQNNYPPESNATVYITDKFSFRYDFIEVDQSGIYKSDTSLFKGKEGEAYILHIILADGSTYKSKSEVLHPLSEITNVSYDFFFNPILPIDDINAKRYFVQAFINDIANVNNFYRWKITVNNVLRNKPEDLLLFDDKFTDGITFRVRANTIIMKKNDVVILEHRSLTKNAFNYFQQISVQLSSGLIPNTLPVIILGNIKNVNDSTEIVLGYFGASAISKSHLIIK